MDAIGGQNPGSLIPAIARVVSNSRLSISSTGILDQENGAENISVRLDPNVHRQRAFRLRTVRMYMIDQLHYPGTEARCKLVEFNSSLNGGGMVDHHRGQDRQHLVNNFLRRLDPVIQVCQHSESA